MALIAKKSRETAPEQLRSFVATHLETLEAGLTVLETSLCLGRSTVDVVAVDHKQTPVLVAVAEVADVPMLVTALDAYIWCLTFPERMRQLYPDAGIATTRPPRLVFVAARMPGDFLDLVERLSVINPECHELAETPEVGDTTTTSGVVPANGSLAETEPIVPEVENEPGSETFLAEAVTAVAVLPASATWSPRVLQGSDSDTDAPASTGKAGHAHEVGTPGLNGRAANDHGANGYGANGHAANGHASKPIGHMAEALLAQAMRAAEPALIEHAAVDLGVVPRLEAAPSAPSPKLPAARPGVEETRMVNHPALQALRFPKSGVSRQWQEFLDQLAANQ
jgi:hypothetical protein